jgi:hypothetical protein
VDVQLQEFGAERLDLVLHSGTQSERLKQN